MKSFLNNFFTITPDEKKAEVAEQPDAPKTPTSVKTTTFAAIENPTIKTESGTYVGSANKQAMEYFENLLKEKNFPGDDYKEFIDATHDEDIKQFAAEQQRYVAAFIGFKRNGLTKEKLIETAVEYQKLIDDDLLGMSAAFENARETEVAAKHTEIELKNKRMQELSAEIETLNVEIQQLNNDAIENENTLNSNKNSFEAAANITKDKITSEIQKITKYLS